MNGGSVLTEGLPDAVWVDGVRIPVETDYRAGLLYDALLQDSSLPAGVRSSLFLEFACGDVPASVDRGRLFAALTEFYTMGQPWGGDTIPAAEPVMDFEEDGDRILASFQAAYGIDLLAVRMHWWQFLTLLVTLPADTVFMQTLRLRMLDLREIEDDGLRRKLRQAKRAVRLRGHRDSVRKGEMAHVEEGWKNGGEHSGCGRMGKPAAADHGRIAEPAAKDSGIGSDGT